MLVPNSPEKTPVYEILDTSKSSNHNTIRNLFIAQKSSKGFNIYSNEYVLIIKHIMHEIEKFNSRLKKKYFFSQIKTSCLLDLEDPFVKYYCSKFPEKQYQVVKNFTEKTNEFSIKPACCANALALWSKTHAIKYNHIYHEVDDCYRVENTGSLRSLSRGCYFTMPDYHLIAQNDVKNLGAIFTDLRSEIKRFYENLLNQDCSHLFYETFRCYDPAFNFFTEKTVYDSPPIIEDLENVEQSKRPYFSIKQEFTLKNDGEEKDLQCGTIQIDLTNPQAFDLKKAAVVHFSMGSLQRLVDLLIIQNKIPMLGLKVKFLNPDHKQQFLKSWPAKYGLIVDDKNKMLSESLAIKSLKEQIFYPLCMIIGETEFKRKTYTVVNRIDRTQTTYENLDALNAYLETQNFTNVPEITNLSFYLMNS